ncbi:MAG: hypothetical protein BMS9Abin13_557 [Patescibacteria group bacterium]|nr:MAG: hypothetical protein BMS9Abin13_557 [Patescibacteria group bacterium]
MESGIKKLSAEEFPHALLELPDPPKELFVKGELPDGDSVLLTVVGSRKFSPYGRDACEKIVAELAGYDIAIVSGLALGIDAIAHKAALAAGLKTIAIPGSGLDESVLYPSTNRLLARKIVEEGGALLSEFSPDFRATVWGFPQRNRIMAGLSRATLIIEAGEKSGTLITARLALDYNKDVYVVPGSIFSGSSRGTNKLMRQGASPITSGADLLQELGFDVAEGESHQAEMDLKNASPDEKKVLEFLREPLPRNELLRALEMPVSAANALLSAMEIKGLVKESAGNMHRER